MRILVADDDLDAREALVKVLQLEGHTVEACRDGRDALKVYLNADEAFDCVVTDYQMPNKNGLGLMLSIRAHESHQPIVLVSADPPRLDDKTKALIGPYEVLQKPYRTEALLAAIKKTCDEMAVSNI